MSTIHLQLQDELVALLQQSNECVERAALELIALELYRRGAISSGKAAEWLGMSRVQFIQHAGQLGIPHFSLTEDEWREEQERSHSL